MGIRRMMVSSKVGCLRVRAREKGGKGMIPTHDGMSNERAYNGWGLMVMEKSGEENTLLDDHSNLIE